MFFKFFYRAVTVLLLISISTGLFVNYTEEMEAGGYTGTNSVMRPQSKQFVVDTFGEYETFEDLFYVGLPHFIFENFIYDLNYMHTEPHQSFDFERFRNEGWRGVCLNYAQFAKSVVLVWSEYKNIDVKCFVVDTLMNDGSGHTYNYFVYDGNTYIADYTSAQTQYKKGESYDYLVKNLGQVPIYEYVIGEKIVNVY